MKMANSLEMWLCCLPLIALIFVQAIGFWRMGMRYKREFNISKSDISQSMRAGLISAGYNEIDNTETVRLTNSLHKIVLDNEIDLQRDVIDAAVREYYHPTLDDSYDHDWHNLVLNWTALIIHTVVYALLAIFSLQFIDRDKR